LIFEVELLKIVKPDVTKPAADTDKK
jgi:hypothetical protein